MSGFVVDHTAHRAAKVNKIKDIELNFISVFS